MSESNYLVVSPAEKPSKRVMRRGEVGESAQIRPKHDLKPMSRLFGEDETPIHIQESRQTRTEESEKSPHNLGINEDSSYDIMNVKAGNEVNFAKRRVALEADGVSWAFPTEPGPLEKI